MSASQTDNASETDVDDSISGVKPASLELPTNVVHDAVGELAEFFLNNTGKPVHIEGGSVQQIGAQGAQVLVMACKAWAAEEVEFRINDASGAIEDCLKVLGMSAEIIVKSNTEAVT